MDSQTCKMIVLTLVHHRHIFFVLLSIVLICYGFGDGLERSIEEMDNQRHVSSIILTLYECAKNQNHSMMFNGANVTSLTNSFKNLKRCFQLCTDTCDSLKNFPSLPALLLKRNSFCLTGFHCWKIKLLGSSLDFPSRLVTLVRRVWVWDYCSYFDIIYLSACFATSTTILI